MSSTINKIRGRSYRTLVDNTPGSFVWNELSFWTHATDVEFNDGETAQAKVGAIHGITTSTSVTSTGYAADATITTNLNKRVNQYVSATLAAGSTTLTFTNTNFGNNTHFDLWTSKFDVAPTAMTLNGTTLTLTFPVQDVNVTVQVYYFNP